MHLPHIPVKIDDFHAEPGVKTYFLSHFHTDHMSGLTPQWRSGTIYCTAITRALVLQQFALPPDSVRAIPYSSLTTIDLDAQQPIDLMVFEANHIPGSCMFLIVTRRYGTVLYTGDFRYDAANSPYFARGSIDHLYVDDTWLHLPDSHEFMTRESLTAAFDAIAQTIETQPESDGTFCPQSLCDVVRDSRKYVLRCFLHNHFGKEPLLQGLALRLKSTIAVDERRFACIQAVAAVDASAIDIDIFRRWACNLAEINCNVAARLSKSSCIEVVNSGRDVAPDVLNALTASTGVRHYAVVISGWTSLKRGRNLSNVWFAPYSLHSSPLELQQFVASIAPASVQSIQHHKRDGQRISERLGPFLRKPGFNSLPSAQDVLRLSAVLLSSSPGEGDNAKRVVEDGVQEKRMSKPGVRLRSPCDDTLDDAPVPPLPSDILCGIDST